MEILGSIKVLQQKISPYLHLSQCILTDNRLKISIISDLLPFLKSRDKGMPLYLVTKQGKPKLFFTVFNA